MTATIVKEYVNSVKELATRYARNTITPINPYNDFECLLRVGYVLSELESMLNRLKLNDEQVKELERLTDFYNNFQK